MTNYRKAILRDFIIEHKEGLGEVLLYSRLDFNSLGNLDNYKPPRLPLGKLVAEFDVFRFD